MEIKPGLSVLMYIFLIYLFIQVSNIAYCYISTMLNIICLGLNIPDYIYQIFPKTFDRLTTIVNLYETEQSERITYCKQQMKYYKEKEVKARKWKITNNNNFIGYMQLYDIVKVLSLKFNDSCYRAALLRVIDMVKQQIDYPREQLSDINTGRVLRKLRETGGPLSSFLVQPMMLFLDGVALFKSGSESVIPIYGINLNLPVEERCNMQNLLLIGIMSTKNCSSFEDYLKYTIQTLNTVWENGFHVSIANNNFRIRSLVVVFSVDIKAKDECIAMKQGGFYRCCYCYHPGKSCNGTVAYPF